MQLNVEQKKIIESKPNGHALIKGVAGSGKTTVAVYKLEILLNNYCPEEDDRILMATYNKSLTKYVEHIYNEVKNNLDIQRNFFQTDNDNKLHIKTIDSLMYYYFQKYIKENNLNLSVINNSDSQEALIDAINMESKKYPHIEFINSKNLSFIKEEIMWIKSCNYMDIEEYQNIDRLGRVSRNNSEGPQKLKKNSVQRQAIFEIMEKYDEILKGKGKVDFQTVGLIALKYAKENPSKKYTHILIDESQDLTRVQIEFIKTLYKEKDYSSITFLADVAQSIYPQAWLVKSRSFASIGYDMKGKSNSLSKSYRTTTQIAQAAFGLINSDMELMDDDNFVKPNLIDKQGECPIYINFKDSISESEYIAKIITSDLKEKYKFKDIVIIARLKNQLEEMQKYLENKNIPTSLFSNNNKFNFHEDSVKLVTMHSIKGLEFKVVIIAGLNSKVMPYYQVIDDIDDRTMIESREKKLLYVGMTRAKEKLFITSNGSPSKFIKDIDYKYLRIKKNCELRRIYTISSDDYMFKDKIYEIYNSEEKVRQWLLREFKESYKYPVNTINIEHPIGIGAKRLFADAVITLDKDKGPFIIAETKAWGKGIHNAKIQLKSYMANTPSAQYGIATDGNEVFIINKELQVVDDIPVFNESMMPASLQSIDYIDLKRGKNYKFIKDNDLSDEIYIEEDGMEVKANNVRCVPVFNEIAAGMPIVMNDSIEGKYYLPEEWVGNNNEVFILKIKGESMIKKNIENGDFVVIKKQNAASIGDIAAVEIDGNATLKTYKTIGDKILLMPENDQYEPIMLEEEQINVLGIAIGIIKVS